MLEASQWAGPPPMAAQPMGIQSTAGAVPVVNEKGKSFIVANQIGGS